MPRGRRRPLLGEAGARLKRAYLRCSLTLESLIRLSVIETALSSYDMAQASLLLLYFRRPTLHAFAPSFRPRLLDPLRRPMHTDELCIEGRGRLAHSPFPSWQHTTALGSLDISFSTNFEFITCDAHAHEQDPAPYQSIQLQRPSSQYASRAAQSVPHYAVLVLEETAPRRPARRLASGLRLHRQEERIGVSASRSRACPAHHGRYEKRLFVSPSKSPEDELQAGSFSALMSDRELLEFSELRWTLSWGTSLDWKAKRLRVPQYCTSTHPPLAALAQDSGRYSRSSVFPVRSRRHLFPLHYFSSSIRQLRPHPDNHVDDRRDLRSFELHLTWEPRYTCSFSHEWNHSSYGHRSSSSAVNRVEIHRAHVSEYGRNLTAMDVVQATPPDLHSRSWPRTKSTTGGPSTGFHPSPNSWAHITSLNYSLRSSLRHLPPHRPPVPRPSACTALTMDTIREAHCLIVLVEDLRLQNSHKTAPPAPDVFEFARRD
ncbi:hypothetical protein C8R45DRAFT_360021 [Mycena sanguinolenta]|nr:hypothetical protein C8R45DRAFT_360021 [Mycena sanguinolenta]